MPDDDSSPSSSSSSPSSSASSASSPEASSTSSSGASSTPSSDTSSPSPYPDASPLSSRAEALLLGGDPAMAVGLSGVAGALFLAVAVLHLPPRLVGGLSVPFGLSISLLAGLAFLAAAVGAYLNDGLLVSLALAGGPSFGFYLPLGLFELTYPSPTVLWGLTVGAAFTVVLGAAGFLVGAGVRRVVGYVARR